jgi:hypothetical protein
MARQTSGAYDAALRLNGVSRLNQLGFFDDEPDDAYDRHRERAGEREREKSASSRDIGDLPAVADPARRAR